MKRVMVRYKVKPDRADENEAYIRGVFAELLENEPPTDSAMRRSNSTTG